MLTITPAPRRWRAEFNGHVIADSDEAVLLRQADQAPAVYFPRQSVSTEYMSRSDRVSHCPTKGDASYFTILMNGDLVENVAWTYETPFPAAQALAGHIAFNPDKVTLYEVDDAAVNPKHSEGAPQEPRTIDQVIQHTDSGSGATQREHWDPTVGRPGEEAGLR